MRGCFVGWRFAYPTWDSRNLSLIYSPVLLKLPVSPLSLCMKSRSEARFSPTPYGRGPG